MRVTTKNDADKAVFFKYLVYGSADSKKRPSEKNKKLKF